MCFKGTSCNTYRQGVWKWLSSQGGQWAGGAVSLDRLGLQSDPSSRVVGTPTFFISR